jgi:hypothetical protein
MGDPYRLDSSGDPSVDELENETRVTLPDEDSGPTKAWLVGVRNTPEWKEHYEWVYGKRPKYELYDLKKDPHETTNLADDPAHAEVKAAMEKELLDVLKGTGDPRMIDDGKFFETPPMAGPLPDEKGFWEEGKAKAGAKGKGKGKGRAE